MKANEYIKKHTKEIIELGDLLYKTPELGYKEHETKRILKEYFKSNNLKVKDLGFETAFSVSIGKGKPHIGLIAELDALPTFGHPYANVLDNNAAHSCGHSTQCAIMASALVALSKQGINKGKVTLFFTPAEEFIDIEYRKNLIKKKKINYIGGKVNMLEAGMFDDVDMFIHLHTTNRKNYDYTIGSRLAGFVYKKITFIGKASHAAIAPEKGIDAMDCFVRFYEEITKLKTAYPKEDMVRLHGIICEGGQSINTVPERISYEMYCRSINHDTLLALNNIVDSLAKKSAKLYGAKAKVETIPGYLPMTQSEPLTKVVESCMKKYSKNIYQGENSIAAGDVGDISVFKPIVQFGYTGFSGQCHNKDLMVSDPIKVYITTSMIVCDCINKLISDDKSLKEIKNYKPKMSKEEYKKYIGELPLN